MARKGLIAGLLFLLFLIPSIFANESVDDLLGAARSTYTYGVTDWRYTSVCLLATTCGLFTSDYKKNDALFPIAVTVFISVTDNAICLQILNHSNNKNKLLLDDDYWLDVICDDGRTFRYDVTKSRNDVLNIDGYISFLKLLVTKGLLFINMNTKDNTTRLCFTLLNFDLQEMLKE